MAVNLTRKTIVAAKTESAYGTDAGPGFATNSADVGGTGKGDFTQLIYGDGAGVYQADTTMVDMPSLTATLSPQAQLAGRSLANVSLQACLCQPTATATAQLSVPYFDPLLVACGIKRTDTNSGPYVSTYAPTSTLSEDVAADVKSATITAYQGGAAGSTAIKTETTGVYMNADFNLTAGQAPTIQFTGQGLYVAPSNAETVPTPTYPSDTKVLVESESLTLQLAGAGNTLSPICRSISFSTGNSIIERGDVNSAEGLKGLQIISRAPTLNLVVEAEDTLRTGAYGSGAATADFFANLKANDMIKANFVHTTATDVTATFTFNNAQLTSVNMSDDGGIRVFNLAFALIGSSGDDEYSIAFSTDAS